MELNWELITQPDQIPQVIEDFGRHQLLGFDFETTGLHYMKDQIHGMGLANPERAWYITMPVLQQLMPWFKDTVHRPDVQTIGHGVKFDLHFLKKLDPTIKPVNLIDTLIAQWLVDENEKLGLKAVAEARLGDVGELLEFKDLQRLTKAELKLKRMEEATIFDFDINMLGEYGAKDPWLCVQLWPQLRWDLVQENQEKIFFEMEMPFIHVIQRMEENGLYVYTDELLSLISEWEALRQDILDEWCERTRCSEYPDGRNPNSNPQLQEWFYGEEYCNLPISFRTKGKAPSTKALAIMRLSHIDETETAKLLLEYKKLDTLLGTFLNPFVEKTHNGYIHTSYNRTGTVTGRLASSKINLQNIPAHGTFGSQVRNVLGAPPGHKFVMIDYSQIELRLAAHYAQVQALIDVFNDPDGDVHQTTADLVGTARYIAKNINFAWFYGAGPRKLCDMIEEKGYPRPKEYEAKQWFYQFGEAYPELVDWKFAVLRAGRKLGHIRTILRRRRHLPELDSFIERDRGRAERQAVNAVIQGSAGDLINWAMLQIDPILDSYDAKMVEQTHDELGFIVPDNAAEEFALIAQEKMVSVEEIFNLSVPIKAEPTIGQTWGDTKED